MYSLCLLRNNEEQSKNIEAQIGEILRTPSLSTNSLVLIRKRVITVKPYNITQEIKCQVDNLIF